MSTVLPTPERSTPEMSPAPPRPFSQLSKPQRVLACKLCQQRKLKCDRKFPCEKCTKSRAQCVPATLAPRHRRRRRFPERELLERLRRYEGLLRQHNINFEPLHTPAAEKASPSVDGRGYDSPDDAHSGGRAAGADRRSRKKTTVKSETVYEAKNFWHAMNQRSRDSDDDDDDDQDDDDSNSSQDDVREAVIKRVWDQLYEGNDHLLFGSPKTNIDFSILHPEQVQIFRLWQIYLENVNPLLKVTHAPTLQARIIDAASDVANINPTLKALMFSIYCVSVLSLAEEECRTVFGSSKEDLLTSYRFGCQQALLDCGFLRSSDRDCLTALFLYLVSVRPDTDPQSLSSMLGVAIRIAQRMGIHNESVYAKCNALEAEMRRRLWWSLILFDTRICELSDYKTAMLAPSWDCRTPLNVNDFDLRPEMKTPPAVHGTSTEALFAVVRSELGEFVRHSAFHLDFTSPALKSVAKDVQHGPVPEGGELVTLDKMMEDKYLKFCNPENPLHFMTIWTARGYLAKNRLMEHYSRYSKSSMQQTAAQRDAAFSHALSMLECDTKLMTSPLIKGYLWLVHFHFPFLAYIHIVQDLRRRPVGEHAEKAWEAMSANHEARFMNIEQNDNPFFKIYSRIVLQAWEAHEAVFRQSDKPLEKPRIVSDIKRKVTQRTPNAQNNVTEQPNGAVSMTIDHYPMSMPVDFGGHGLLYGMGGQGFAGSGPGDYPDIPGQNTMEIDVNPLDWATIDWTTQHGGGW